MNKFTLISFKLCPYVQRVAISMREKGIPFELVYVDLADKPEWFTAISPLGKVPLLRVDEGSDTAVLFESSVILEYLEDIGQGRSMHSVDPVEKALQRGWMEFGSSLLADIWSLETATGAAAYESAVASLNRKLDRLENTLGSGPFFTGTEFTFVDAVFAPAFRYFDVFDAFMERSVLARFAKVAAWRQALAQRPSVAAAVVPEYAELLHDFLRSKGAWLIQTADIRGAGATVAHE